MDYETTKYYRDSSTWYSYLLTAARFAEPMSIAASDYALKPEDNFICSADHPQAFEHLHRDATVPMEHLRDLIECRLDQTRLAREASHSALWPNRNALRSRQQFHTER